ncbi:metalloendoproteinase 1-like [Momordica charantia]|uniref:Metalloendoproteinase 1-like n=1 Tax=Momordica charantia TaxID=3673 RepID=A0A6J1BZQ4_MOMCH|nr:metalloendoproteinase 1-like [Momordica charantia]
MALKSLKIFLFTLLIASIAKNAISIRDLHRHKSVSSPFSFPHEHLQDSRKGDTVEGIHNVKLYLQHFDYLTNLPAHAHNTFDDPLESALKTYQKNYHLNATATANVKIPFEKGDHGDVVPFCTPILAHSFFSTDERLHFNVDQNWAWGAVAGAVDVQTVALHELGHILGLAHNQDECAIMYAYICPGTTKCMTQDDIARITDLYSS